MAHSFNATEEVNKRVEWISSLLAESGCTGVVFGNSGGKDCTLVGALCRLATKNVVGIIMPCDSVRNYGRDRDDAIFCANYYDVKTLEVDLSPVKQVFKKAVAPLTEGDNAQRLTSADININPRLRMMTVYVYAAAHNCLVAGTGNRSEIAMGYFTKWGDGAYDFNPIADLTVTEVYAMLRELNAPDIIMDKVPSAGLYEGQTDEDDLGISYKAIDDILLYNKGSEADKAKVDDVMKKTEHKRNMPKTFKRN